MILDPALIGVVGIGLLHGAEPGHGWPLAILYSVRKRNAVLGATVSSGIIGLAHLISSIAVVVVYVLLQRYLNFNAPWIKYIAAGLLVFLAARLWMEKTDGMEKQHGHIHPGQADIEHEHKHEHHGDEPHTHVHKHIAGATLSLFGLATIALVLGFAHEEEFALLALVASGVNAWALMLSYGLAVVLGLMAVTIIGVLVYERVQHRLLSIERYVPKVSAVILLVMAALVIFL